MTQKWRQRAKRPATLDAVLQFVGTALIVFALTQLVNGALALLTLGIVAAGIGVARAARRTT